MQFCYFFGCILFQQKQIIFSYQKDKKRIATSLNNIASVFADQGKYEKAAEYDLKALHIFQEQGQPHLRGCVAGKAIELMNFSKFFCEWSRRNAIAKFPTGATIGFAKRKTDKTSL